MLLSLKSTIILLQVFNIFVSFKGDFDKSTNFCLSKELPTEEQTCPKDTCESIGCGNK